MTGMFLSQVCRALLVLMEGSRNSGVLKPGCGGVNTASDTGSNYPHKEGLGPKYKYTYAGFWDLIPRAVFTSSQLPGTSLLYAITTKPINFVGSCYKAPCETFR